MLTRRCTQRTFLMRPDPETNNAFIYCLAYAANRCGVQVFFFMAASNHYHAGVIDPEGRLPEFIECFHKLFAKHQNALRGRWENFWSTEPTSAVHLADDEAVIEKTVYGLSNPAKDHLVARSSQWPGATSIGRTAHAPRRRMTATRPKHFFRHDGPMPASIVLELQPPPITDANLRKVLRHTLAERISAVESAAADERRRTGRQVIGVHGILAQHWEDRPTTHEPRREMDPRLACKDKWRRIESLARSKRFQAEYRIAWELWQSGAPVVFPEGTYWMKRFARVRCSGQTETATAA